MTISEENASKIACKILREHFLDNDGDIGTYDDDYIINNYSEEWSWFMTGWKHAIEQDAKK